MTMSDPIADMLTRIRNANTAKHDTVDVPASKMKIAIANILVDEGYIAKYDLVEDGAFKTIHITLKYGETKNDKIITGLKRISKPGLRIYAGKDELPRVLGGLGIAILSTNKGVITDKEARKLQVGGEVLAFVWSGKKSAGRFLYLKENTENREDLFLSDNLSKEDNIMSRIGRLPVAIPAGVEVSVAAGNVVTVKGPKGTLERALPTEMEIKVEDGHVVVTRPNDLKKMKALHGLTRSLIHNMVVGVSEGYTKELEVNGVGYRAQKQGKKLVLSLGYSHPVEMEDPEGLESKVDGNKIIVSGISKEKVGQYAAEIRDKRRPEPYKGKGIKYADEVIRRKVGKTGKK